MDTKVKLVIIACVSITVIAIVVIACIFVPKTVNNEDNIPKSWPTPGPIKESNIITSPPVPGPPAPTEPPIVCGPGTKINDNRCVIDFEGYRSTLGSVLDKSVINLSGTTTYVGLNKAVMEDIQRPWETHWESNRSLEISPGNVGCMCGDCAGWRGGNSTVCSSNQLFKPDDKHRVRCVNNTCVCEDGYSPVWGLCVRGYSQGCPKCILNGTCAGRVMCENDKVLKVQRVSYPGTRYTCADKKGDLVYNSMGDVERECVLANDNNGMSEYECVLKCQSDAKLDKDCSKECLPELWVWNKIKVGNEVVGYYQTGDLAQYADTSYSLSTCNPYKVSDVTMNIIDCEECTDCKWVKNGETYDYQCTKCDRCNGGDNDAYCKGGTCRNCDLSGRCKSCSSITDCGKYSRNEKTGCTMGLYNKGENYNPSQIKVPPGNEALCIRYKGTTCDNGITKDGGVLGKTWWGTTTLINY